MGLGNGCRLPAAKRCWKRTADHRCPRVLLKWGCGLRSGSCGRCGKRVVAAFHAGWRGTVARIVGGVALMESEYGSRVEDLIAAVGPSIGPCCYSVGGEVRSEFGAQFGYSEELFDRGDAGEMRLNLWEANRRQLMDAGVGEARISVVGECTACSRDASGALRYFASRRRVLPNRC